jgi:hypothetical protein
VFTSLTAAESDSSSPHKFALFATCASHRLSHHINSDKQSHKQTTTALALVVIFCEIVLTSISTWAVWEYVHLKTTGWLSLVMVWVGWYLGFAPVLLIPVDIVSV